VRPQAAAGGHGRQQASCPTAAIQRPARFSGQAGTHPLSWEKSFLRAAANGRSPPPSALPCDRRSGRC